MTDVVDVLEFVFIAAVGGFALMSVVCLAAAVLDILFENAFPKRFLSRSAVLERLTGTTKRWVLLLVVCTLVVAVGVAFTSP